MFDFYEIRQYENYHKELSYDKPLHDEIEIIYLLKWK